MLSAHAVMFLPPAAYLPCADRLQIHTKSRSFSASMTLSFRRCKSLKEQTFFIIFLFYFFYIVGGRRWVFFICLSIQVGSGRGKVETLFFFPIQNNQKKPSNKQKQCHHSACIKFNVIPSVLTETSGSQASGCPALD